MQAKEISNMFSFNFQKSTAEIKEAATRKASQIKTKVEERQRRIVNLRREYEIDDAAFLQILTEARRQQRHTSLQNYSYGAKVLDERTGTERTEERTIGAGVINNLLTESDFIEAEKQNVKRLETMVRNIRPITKYAINTGGSYTVETYELSYEEVEYLGF